MRMLQIKQTSSAISFHLIKAAFSPSCLLWNPEEFQHPAAESVAPGTKHSCPPPPGDLLLSLHYSSLTSVCSLAPYLSDGNQGKAHAREAVLRKTEDLVWLMNLRDVCLPSCPPQVAPKATNGFLSLEHSL